MKKTGFLSFLIISLALTAFLAGYVLVKRGADINSGSKTGTILDKFNGSETDTSNAMEVEDGVPIPFTDRRVTSIVNSYNKGEVFYFEKGTGKLLSLNLETKTEQSVLNKALSNFVSATWSPTKKEFVATFGSDLSADQTDSPRTFKYFNIETGEEVSLDPNIRSGAFSPDGSLLAYHYSETNDGQSPTGKIFISEPNGKHSKKIIDTRLENIKMGWPIREKMSFINSGSEMFLLTEEGELTKVLDLKPGLREKWSPSAKKIIFSVSSLNPEQQGNILSLKNIETREEIELGPGSASKCVWSVDDINAFCAIPKSPSVDEVYKINTSTGTQKLVAEPLAQVGEILLVTGEERLLFINTSDEKLYSIKIPD